MKKTEEKKVFKLNKLIEAHCRYMNATEYKLINVGLSKIRDGEYEIVKDSIIVEFTVEEYCNLMEIQKNGSYSHIYNTSDKLMERVFVFEEGNKPEKDWKKMQWVTCSEYKSGKLRLEYSHHITDYILYNKEKKEYFTLYPLDIILQMKSYYSIRLYELLMQYQHIPSRKFCILKLKSLLGVPLTSYTEYKYFKRKILIPCMKEINKVSNLQIKLNEVKESRKVVELDFKIYKKLNFNEDYITKYENLPKENLFDLVKNLYQIETGYVIKYGDIENFHRNILIECIEKLELGKFNKTNIKNPKKYLLTVLKNLTKDSKDDLTKIRDY